MPTYTLIGRNEFPSADSTRVGKTDVIYGYQDETLKTILITLPLEEDSPERVETELRKRAAAAAAAGPRQVIIE